MLRRLDLSFNGFSGRVPARLADIPQLEVLDVRNNSLSGFLPTGKSLPSLIIYTKSLTLFWFFFFFW